MTTTKRVRVEVALNTIEKTIIDNDVEVHGITRAEAIRRRAFDKVGLGPVGQICRQFLDWP